MFVLRFGKPHFYPENYVKTRTCLSLFIHCQVCIASSLPRIKFSQFLRTAPFDPIFLWDLKTIIQTLEMKQILTVLIAVIFSLLTQTLVAQENPAASTAKLTSFKATINNDKVILDWEVDANESTNLFEVEKSADGKIFSLTALVFGSEKAEKDNYQYFEKIGKEKLQFRIKMIGKDKKISYSEIVSVNSAGNL